MRLNLPVLAQEHEIPDEGTLLSATDTKSRVTYANAAFLEASGFSRDELLGQPHNIVRHPDMPAQAFADMWRTLGHGDSWTALVKNRCKDGRFYWVRANATPVVRDGRLTGYMSVRTKPSRAEIAVAERLYAALRDAKTGSRALHKGILVGTGLRRLLSLQQTLPVRWRLRGGVAALALAAMAGALVAGVAPAAFGMLSVIVLAAAACTTAWLEHQIAAPLAVVLRQARSVAAGTPRDLPQLDRVDEIGMVLRSINQAGLNLRSLVDDVNLQVAGVRRASDSLSRGNDELRRRTEQAAASLQQTAASLEQMASTVNANADRATEVADLAATARSAAAGGGTAVAAVAARMGEISATSRRIADIIGVIDGIAFQTNILALNAAVEAARAGEHGRGFAVVAGEVRSLAQSSAAAAKEIKSLILASVDGVEAGVTQAEAARAAMDDVVERFGAVSDLQAAITAASKEQAVGIEQINTAVGQLDQVTQQNANLVEASSIAAQDLAQRAATLTAAIAVFKPLPAGAAPA